jgi:TRAP-type C4-dicarboxylate transport system permease small subunit
MLKSRRERIEDMIIRVETALGALVFAALFGAVTIQVFYRYVLHSPLVWPFEFSIYCYIAIVYLGGAMAARRGSHVSFDLVSGRLPGRVRMAVAAVLHVFLIVVFALTIWPAIGYMNFIGHVRSTALGIPWAWVIALYPAGMALVILHLMVRVWDDVRGIVYVDAGDAGEPGEPGEPGEGSR